MAFHLLKRLFQAPANSFFLFGPRGTGKSTLCRKIFPDAFYIDLLISNVRRGYATYPEFQAS